MSLDLRDIGPIGRLCCQRSPTPGAGLWRARSRVGPGHEIDFDLDQDSRRRSGGGPHHIGRPNTARPATRAGSCRNAFEGSLRGRAENPISEARVAQSKAKVRLRHMQRLSSQSTASCSNLNGEVWRSIRDKTAPPPVARAKWRAIRNTTMNSYIVEIACDFIRCLMAQARRIDSGLKTHLTTPRATAAPGC